MYHPEPYWNEVAERIGRRGDLRIIAGDDEPFYRYKRNKFLRLFHSLPFEGNRVLEVGCGPGGNLLEAWKHGPAELHGVDISERMIALAQKNLAGIPVHLTKLDDTSFPFPGQRFDLCFTSTVLQHNTDEAMLRGLVREICRVTRNEAVLFEKIEPVRRGTELCVGRPVRDYAALMEAEGFQLEEVRYLNIQVSFLVSGALRKLLNPRGRKEGEPLSRPSLLLQKLSLPLTTRLDSLFPAKRDVAMMRFRRKRE